MDRPFVFLADLIRGLEALKIRDPQIAKEVVRMLSLERLEAGPATRLGGAFDSRILTPPAPSTTTPPKADDPRSAPGAPAPPALSDRRDARLRQVTPAATSSSVPAWISSVVATPRAAGATVTRKDVEPLFPKAQSRGLLAAAISTWSADGRLDIPRVVDTLARAEPLRQLPLELTTSMRLGVQLLVDTSGGMGPYRADIDQACLAIDRLVVDGLLELRYFSGCPSRGCAAPGSSELRAWLPPVRGTPVLILTDLGIGAPPGTDERASPSEWMAFAAMVRGAGCTPIAFVPYGPRRWPRALARAMHIIHWDRRTTAGQVRRAVAAGVRASR